jgi:hypothetical protein
MIFQKMVIAQTCAASHQVKSSQSQDFDFFEKNKKSQSQRKSVIAFSYLISYFLNPILISTYIALKV